MSTNENSTPTTSGVSDPAGEVLVRTKGILEKNALAPIKAFKEENPDSLVVGHMPIYSPRPVLEAIGCLPVAVYGAGDVDIIRGDSFFQSYICHIPRSTVEIGMNGGLSDLDGMVFPSTCDVIRNLSGMWQLLFPDVYSTYLDLPQNFDKEVGGKFYQYEMKRIARELGERGAKPLTEEALEKAIVDENRRHRALRKVAAVRLEEPWRVPASEAYQLTRAGSSLTALAHAELIEEYLSVIPERTGSAKDHVRVVLAGSFCEQPPLALIVSLEKSGCDVVIDDFMLGLDYMTAEIEEGTGNGIKALADAFINVGQQSAARYIDKEVKGQALIDKVKIYRADGVVFSAASFCDPALLDQPMQEAALDREGIPYTSFKFAENTGQFQVIREQAGAFSDAVRLWGSAT
ncbi:MAG: benzoyl-CoA reductase subunit C [Deltaproteobacteria bacterium]|nr:benzoyl-CoA reductase subunit C [Deltaproteobacteria bacterium]